MKIRRCYKCKKTFESMWTFVCSDCCSKMPLNEGITRFGTYGSGIRGIPIEEAESKTNYEKFEECEVK